MVSALWLITRVTDKLHGTLLPEWPLVFYLSLGIDRAGSGSSPLQQPPLATG